MNHTAYSGGVTRGADQPTPAEIRAAALAHRLAQETAPQHAPGLPQETTTPQPTTPQHAPGLPQGKMATPQQAPGIIVPVPPDLPAKSVLANIVKGVGPDGPVDQAELDRHHGYVYRMEHLPTGRYYIGKHRHEVGESFTYYRGSGRRWVAKVLSVVPGSEVRKDILSFHEDDVDLERAERWWIFTESLHADERFMNTDRMFALDWVRDDAGNLLDPYETWGLGNVSMIGDVWVASYRIHDHARAPEPFTLRVVAATKEEAVAARQQALRDYDMAHAEWLSLPPRLGAVEPRPRCDPFPDRNKAAGRAPQPS